MKATDILPCTAADLAYIEAQLKSYCDEVGAEPLPREMPLHWAICWHKGERIGCVSYGYVNGWLVCMDLYGTKRGSMILARWILDKGKRMYKPVFGFVDPRNHKMMEAITNGSKNKKQPHAVLAAYCIMGVSE
jgi:hypothetical protein